MNDVYAILVDKFVVFVLVLVRMSSIFVITPVFGRKNMPAYLKVGFAFLSALIIVPLLGDVQVDYKDNLLYFAVMAAQEFIIGIIIGYVSTLVFSAIFIAGQIIDVQIGFGMVNILDPMQDTQVPLTGNFIYILTTMFFLIINGHHILFGALFKSYSIIPINGFAYNDVLVNNILTIFIEVFAIGFKIALPVLAAALLCEVALGILAKTVPQMNVFVVGIPLKLGVGLLTLYFVLPVFFRTMSVTFDKMYSYIYLIIKSMAKG